MPDLLGRIAVPTPSTSGLSWPLTSEYAFIQSRPFPIVTHSFGERASLTTQRFAVGIGPRRFEFAKERISFAERRGLVDFYNAVQGSFQSFRFHAPNPDNTFTDYDVIFDPPAPLSIADLASACRTGVAFVESVGPESAPVYGIADVCTRFPNQVLNEALLSQTQQLIPLIHLRVREQAVPDIYLSDRRVTVGNQLYLPRILGLGEPGSDVILSQDISGRADNVSFTFGNADRVMSALNRDTGLKFADIDLSFYHVQTGILLQLWKGIIISFAVDASAQFRVTCSDGLYPITQNYPRRTYTRQCWKPFNKEIYPGFKPCPYSERGAGGNPAGCDYFFNSTNGCVAHGMTPFFGGQPAFPQSVNIKDNGTGVIFGFGRDRVTSTSIISDSVWGSPLPEIWCNDDGDPRKAFWANAIVTAVRDESDFEDILGIIGAGPLGAYEGMSVQTNADGYTFLVTPLADGFPPQGFKVDGQLRVTSYHPELGLREVLGNDPADPATDPFSLGQGTPQHWEIPDPTFGSILPLAAGTAFVELRYAKSAGSGLSPTTTESHSMQVPVARGLTGVTYDAGGAQSVVEGLTNPFWVAVNTYLRALGIDRAEATVQLSAFVLNSLVNGGAGCAEIADLQVAPVVGDPSTTETQFRFQGTLAEFKPYRDWLSEILTCALGYYTFEFGKLRLGIRENARDTSAFTVGNMLYQSLSLTPVEASFEYLKLDFANRDLQYQQDMAEYQDKDHAAYFGRSGAPLTARQRSVGLAGLSQALRLAATRVREEIGGVLRPDQSNPYIEWDNAFVATWKTTILALETAVGQVVSVTHPDVPSYPGPVAGSPGSSTYRPQPPNTWNYRIQRWALHRDYSISIVGRSVTDSMYDLEVGPKPAEVLPTALPVLFYAQPRGEWAPYQIQAPDDDSLFPGEWNFQSDQEYTDLADGTSGAFVIATGKLPVNSFIPECGAPDLKKGKVTQSTADGAIPGGTTYRVSVCARNADGLVSPASDVLIIQVPAGSDGNSFTLHGIKWPKAPGLTGFTVFVSDQDDLICAQQDGELAGDESGYLPADISVLGPFARSTWALPNPATRKVRLKAKRLIHSGIAGVSVTEVLAPNQIICTSLIDTRTWDSMTHTWDEEPGTWDSSEPSSPIGRVLSVIGRRNAITPWISFLVTDFDNATGTLTFDHDCVVDGHPELSIQVDDAVVLRNIADSDNSDDPTKITDSGYINVTNGYSGLGVNEDGSGVETGNLIRVIAGKRRGQIRKIVNNTADTLFFDAPLELDQTSVWIVEEANYPYAADSTDFDNPDPNKPVTLSAPVDNYIEQPVLVAGFTVDTDGVESEDGDGPIREEWIFGTAGVNGPGVIAYA